MKATGIVRRIDDLGRVVIPKEIRRTMRIREGDPLEIFTSNDGEVVFKKYSLIGELSDNATIYAEILAKNCDFSVVICDRDHCVAASGISKKEVLSRRISEWLEEVIESRTGFVLTSNEQKIALEGISCNTVAAIPILSSGDVVGAVVLMSDNNEMRPSESDVKIASVAASYLGKQIEQ